MEALTLDRYCSICGKRIKCRCFYADYGLVVLDRSGELYVDFDACPDCMEKVIEQVKQIVHPN